MENKDEKIVWKSTASAGIGKCMAILIQMKATWV